MKTKANLKETVKNLIFLRSMFSRLVASFILIIIIISSFHFITNLIYSRNMEREITNSVSSRFDYLAYEYQTYFDEIKDKILVNFYLKYRNALKAPGVSGYDSTLMLNDMKTYPKLHKYISDFVVLKRGKYVLTLDGTMMNKYFFSNQYISTYYTESFWLKESAKGYTFKIYPMKRFGYKDILSEHQKESEATIPEGQMQENESEDGTIKYKDLLPVVWHAGDSNTVIITMVDFDSLANSMDPDFRNNFYIFDEGRQLLYSTKNNRSNDIVKEINNKLIINKKNVPTHWKYKNGYIFTYSSSDDSLLYCKFYPNSIVTKQLNYTNRVLTLIIFFSMLVSIILSVFMVKKFNNPVKQIYTMVKQSGDISGRRKEFIDLKDIKEDIAGIIKENTNYIKDINEKNSLLKSYFYQVRLKNIILSDDEADRNTSESGSYTVILFKIHFRDAFYTKMSSDISKGSYILKDMIHVYIDEFFKCAVTFQIEKDQVISIVNINEGIAELEANIKKIVDKLGSEDEYVYFTVVYSKIYDNSSELHEAYRKVTELLRFRKLETRTQVLSESRTCTRPDRLYFTEDQQKQFDNLLRSGKKDECIRLIDKAFDYNVKNEINEFSMYLLFTKVMECCSNVLMQLYNEIPADLSLVNDYLFLGQYESIDDYKKRYTDIIKECADYIEKNQKQTDYIVDYVKNYINDNYSNDITVEMLADKLNISHTYLSRYFKNTTGINLSDYLNVFRMKKACLLLQNSFIPVKDIAPKVGIYNISTFMRSFKSYTGKSPNDYRKSLMS